MPLKTKEFYSGTKSFSTAAQKRGHETWTVDNNKKLHPDPVYDLSRPGPQFKAIILKDRTDALWASPPCTAFSVASISRHWTKDRQPKSPGALLAIQLVKATTELIEHLLSKNPRLVWFIENPHGMLRTQKWFDEWVVAHGGKRHTITYCQYGDTRQKPTDIWTNSKAFNPKPACKTGSPCHAAAPRGSKTPGSTQHLSGAKERGRIPEAFCTYVVECLEEEFCGSIDQENVD